MLVFLIVNLCGLGHTLMTKHNLTFRFICIYAIRPNPSMFTKFLVANQNQLSKFVFLQVLSCKYILIPTFTNKQLVSA